MDDIRKTPVSEPSRLDQIKLVSAELVAHEREVARLTATLAALVGAAPYARAKKPSVPLKSTKPKTRRTSSYTDKLRQEALERAKPKLLKAAGTKPRTVTDLRRSVRGGLAPVRRALDELVDEGLLVKVAIVDGQGKANYGWKRKKK